MSDTGPDFSKLGYNTREEYLDAVGLDELGPNGADPGADPIVVNQQPNSDPRVEVAAADEITADTDLPPQTLNVNPDDSSIEDGAIITVGDYELNLAEFLPDVDFEILIPETDVISFDYGELPFALAEIVTDSVITNPWVEIFNSSAAMMAGNANLDILADVLAEAENDGGVRTVRSEVADAVDEKEKRKRDAMRIVLSAHEQRMLDLVREIEELHLEIQENIDAASNEAIIIAGLHAERAPIASHIAELEAGQADLHIEMANNVGAAALAGIEVGAGEDRGAIIAAISAHRLEHEASLAHAGTRLSIADAMRAARAEDPESGITDEMIASIEQLTAAEHTMLNAEVELAGVEASILRQEGIRYEDTSRIMTIDGERVYVTADGSQTILDLDADQLARLNNAQEVRITASEGFTEALSQADRFSPHAQAIAAHTAELAHIYTANEALTALYEERSAEITELEGQLEQINAQIAIHEQLKAGYIDAANDGMAELGGLMAEYEDGMGPDVAGLDGLPPLSELQGQQAALQEQIAGLETQRNDAELGLDNNMAAIVAKGAQIEAAEAERAQRDEKMGIVRDEDGQIVEVEEEGFFSFMDDFFSSDISENFDSAIDALAFASMATNPLMLGGFATNVANFTSNVTEVGEMVVDSAVETVTEVKDNIVEAAQGAYSWVTGWFDGDDDEVQTAVTSEPEEQLGPTIEAAEQMNYETSSASSFSCEAGGPSDLSTKYWPEALAAFNPFQTSPAMPGTPEYEAEQAATTMVAQADTEEPNNDDRTMTMGTTGFA